MLNIVIYGVDGKPKSTTQPACVHVSNSNHRLDAFTNVLRIKPYRPTTPRVSSSRGRLEWLQNLVWTNHASYISKIQHEYCRGRKSVSREKLRRPSMRNLSPKNLQCGIGPTPRNRSGRLDGDRKFRTTKSSPALHDPLTDKREEHTTPMNLETLDSVDHISSSRQTADDDMRISGTGPMKITDMPVHFSHNRACQSMSSLTLRKVSIRPSCKSLPDSRGVLGDAEDREVHQSIRSVECNSRNPAARGPEADDFPAQHKGAVEAVVHSRPIYLPSSKDGRNPSPQESHVHTEGSNSNYQFHNDTPHHQRSLVQHMDTAPHHQCSLAQHVDTASHQRSPAQHVDTTPNSHHQRGSPVQHVNMAVRHQHSPVQRVDTAANSSQQRGSPVQNVDAAPHHQRSTAQHVDTAPHHQHSSIQHVKDPLPSQYMGLSNSQERHDPTYVHHVSFENDDRNDGSSPVHCVRDKLHHRHGSPLPQTVDHNNGSQQHHHHHHRHHHHHSSLHNAIRVHSGHGVWRRSPKQKSSSPDDRPSSTVPPIVRFRRAVKTVQVLQKATDSGRHPNQTAFQPVLSSWIQLSDELDRSKRTLSKFGLIFDPSQFRARREIHLSNEAKAILSMDTALRTEEQKHVALVSLNQSVESFSEFPIRMQKSLVRVGFYEHFESKRVIIRQGHFADNFYFILSGKAIVTILESNKQTGEEIVRTAAFLKKGNSFGELALMHGAKRSASVMCMNDVELLAVGREDFIDIFMHIEKDREPEHIRYMRTIDMLRGWPIEIIPYDNPKICLFTYFRRGVLLCKDSNSTEWIYIVKSGTCKVLKTLKDTKPNIPGLEFQTYSFDSKPTKLPQLSKPFPSISALSFEDKSPSGSPSPYLVSRMKTPSSGRKSKQKRKLPAVRERSEEELKQSAEEHLRKIENIYTQKHRRKEEYPEDLESENRTMTSTSSYSQTYTEPETVFVQVTRLGPKDIFGLEHAILSAMTTTTSVSLVSEGAECVLISKKFFLQHLPDTVRKRLRLTIQPYPSEESLQQKLQDKTNWNAYKTMAVNDYVTFSRDVQDKLSLYY